MSGDRPRDAADLLAVLLSRPNPEVLRQIDLENMALGSFVKGYTAPPPPADLGTRSSIREDSVISEISRLLLDAGTDDIFVLDACCGLAALPKRIIQSMGEGIQRISYLAVDEDPNSIRLIRSQQHDFQSFKNFTPLQRHVSDLGDLQKGSLDLIVINNALHEIPPRFYPSIFATFNTLLNPDRGVIYIVDLESLPADSPEAIAITWTGSEVESILRAGRLSPVLTRHAKASVVYQAQVRHASQGVDQSAMLSQIVYVLQRKLAESIIEREKVAALLRSNPAYLQSWIVLTGTIARCAEELHSIG